MELIKTVTENIQQNQHRQTPSTVTAISTDAEKILGVIIFRTRLAKGWNGYDVKTQNLAVQTWFEILSTEKIPYQFFDELYRRACNYQAHILQQGKEPPDMSAQLMVAQWIGENGLCKEIERRRIEEGRTLPDTAKSQCPRCLGSGWHTFKDEHGYETSKRCIH